jgi:hypothetical protein
MIAGRASGMASIFIAMAATRGHQFPMPRRPESRRFCLVRGFGIHLAAGGPRGPASAPHAATTSAPRRRGARNAVQFRRGKDMRVLTGLCVFAAVLSWCGYVASIGLCIAQRRPGITVSRRRGAPYNILLYPSLLTPQGRRSRKRALLFLAACFVFVLSSDVLFRSGRG